MTQMELESLFVDEDALDTRLLVEAIRPLARIVRETGAPRFTPEGARLSDRARVYVALLARAAWACSELGRPDAVDLATLKQQVEPRSVDSLRKALQRLADERLAERTGKQWRAMSVTIEEGKAYLQGHARRRGSRRGRKSHAVPRAL